LDSPTITHILVPLDGSDASEVALGPARELADRFGAELTLTTVMLRFPESRIHVPKMDERSKENGLAYLADVRSRHELPDSVNLEVHLGTPAESIAEAVNSNGVDLVVMSTHGTTGSDKSRHSLGSVAWKVMQHPPCPVYLVPIRRP
jgi:nucleotide-binding universal stress UspA family protein